MTSNRAAKPKASMLVVGGLTMFALTGCSSPEPEGRNFPAIESPSAASEPASDHLGVARNFVAPYDWKLVKESDRTKPDGTEVHNIRWDTGTYLVTTTDLRSAFDKNGITLDECYEQTLNCTGTIPVEGGTVKVSLSGVAWKDMQTQEPAGNEVFMDVSIS